MKVWETQQCVSMPTDMTMEEVREYERATQEATNLKIGTFPPAISISETPLPSCARGGPNSAPSTPLSTEAPEFLTVPKERPRKKSAPETLTLPDPGRRDSIFKLPGFFSWNSSPQPEWDTPPPQPAGNHPQPGGEGCPNSTSQNAIPAPPPSSASWSEGDFASAPPADSQTGALTPTVPLGVHHNVRPPQTAALRAEFHHQPEGGAHSWFHPPERRLTSRVSPHKPVQSPVLVVVSVCGWTSLNTVSVVCAGFHLCLCILTLCKHLGRGYVGTSGDAAAAVAFLGCSVHRCMTGAFSVTLSWLQGRVLTDVSDGPRVIAPLYPL